MSRTLVLIGTRKGCFLLESDADRQDWTMRGPFCESWPVYHAVHDQAPARSTPPPRASGTAPPIWRSPDLGETWEQSSEGITYGDGAEVSKVSTLAAGNDRLLVGVEAPGIFESKDNGATWSLLSTLEGQPGSEVWDDPANQPPGHLGISALDARRGRPGAVLRDRAGGRVFETRDGGRDVDAAQPGPARRLARASTRRSASASTSWSARRRPSACSSRTTSACTAPTTAATLDGDHGRACPGSSGSRPPSHPHDRDTF